MDSQTQTINQTQTKKPCVVLKSCELVAEWTYKVSNTQCLICKNDLTDKCLSCLENKNVTTATCTVSKGRCGHGFHAHCISSWIKKGTSTCPVDHAPWNYEKENMDDVAVSRQGFKAKA